MNTHKVIIKQKPGDVARYFGWDQLPLPVAIHPSTSQIRYPRTEKDGRTYVTGLNEFSPRINAITDKSEREKQSKKIKALRLELEQQLNVDLGPVSDFWKSFEVPLIVKDQPETIWDLTDPLTRLKYIVALENRWVAPSLEDTYNEPYQDCLLYLHDEVSGKSRRLQTEELNDEVGGLLSGMKNNQQKLFYVGHLLQLPVNRQMNREDLYLRISEYRKKQKTLEDLEQLKKALEHDNSYLFVSYLVREGFKRKKFTNVDGIWTFNETGLGDSRDTVIEALQEPIQAPTLERLQSVIEKG